MRFVQGIDYGPRKGTLGFAIHMAEGGDGTLPYLARRSGESDARWRERVRGVSSNFVILSTGETVQMVRWDRASGSMNPSDRGKTTGFYRTQVIQEVLGAKYIDPNAYSLSVEITGYRNVGPNRAQVEALIALIAEARDRYPSLRGAYGHADQTSTKGCPGTAPLMLEAWQRIGHGLFTLEEAMPLYSVPGRIKAQFPAGTPHYEVPGGTQTGTIKDATTWFDLVAQNDEVATFYLIDGGLDADVMRWVKASAVKARANVIPDPKPYTITISGNGKNTTVGTVTLP